MPASLTTASNILKIVYEDRVREQINNRVKLLKYCEKSSTGVVSGKYVDIALHVTRNSGVGARRERENLPSAGQQGYAEERIGLKYLYGRIEVSGPSIKLSDTNTNSFARVLEQEVTRIKDDLAVDLNRQCYGNGTGALGATSSTTSITTPVITSGIQNFQEGMVVDVFTAANFAAEGAAKATGTVLAVGTSTITLSAAVAFAAGDIFTRTGNINREITGLGAIVNDTGTLYNVDPNTYPIWKSTVDANAGVNRVLGESMMIRMSDAIVQKGSNPSVIFTSLGVRRAYFNLLEQQREFTQTGGSPGAFGGGFTGLSFATDDGAIPVVSDKDCPPSTMYFLDTTHLKVYQDSDWAWLDMTGSKWQQVPNQDAYSATLQRYMELATDRRNAFGVIRDITEA
jgi:hypothetical protein